MNENLFNTVGLPKNLKRACIFNTVFALLYKREKIKKIVIKRFRLKNTEKDLPEPVRMNFICKLIMHVHKLI